MLIIEHNHPVNTLLAKIIQENIRLHFNCTTTADYVVQCWYTLWPCEIDSWHMILRIQKTENLYEFEAEVLSTRAQNHSNMQLKKHQPAYWFCSSSMRRPDFQDNLTSLRSRKCCIQTNKTQIHQSEKLYKWIIYICECTNNITIQS
jgi:hypothetical protein